MTIFNIKIKTIIIPAALLLCLALLHLLDLDDRLLYRMINLITPAKVKAESVWLNDYSAIIDGKIIEGVESNASGITYSHETDTLFIILNGPTRIVETTRNGNVLRGIDLVDFEDTEGICHMGGPLFAVVEERKSRITVINIHDHTLKITRKSQPGLTLTLSDDGNKGFEGIAWNGAIQQFTVLKERSPMAIYNISRFSSNNGSPQAIKIARPRKIDPKKLFLDDLSGLHFNEKTGNLLILSHESRLLAEVDLHGKQLSFLELSKGFSGLSDNVPQAEGVTMDEEGTLYIVSEPNLFYAFSPPRRASLANKDLDIKDIVEQDAGRS